MSKEFSQGFARQHLSSLAHIDKESLGSSTGKDFSFYYISLSDVNKGKINPNLEYFRYESAPSRARRLVKKGDVLLSTVRPNLQGFAKIGEKNDGNVVSTGFSVLTPKDSCCGDYLYQYLFSAHITGQINALVVGSNYPAINSSDVKGLNIYCPQLNEQKKIAEILSTWDKAITTTEKLLKNSQQQKKALMQQLLTGKSRIGFKHGEYALKKVKYGHIPSDWQYESIKNICSSYTKKNSDRNDYPVLSCSKYDGFVDSLSYFKKKVYSDDTTGYRVIPYGYFGFPANHVEEGSIGLQKLYDYGLVSPIYVVFEPNSKKVNSEFLYAVLKTDRYRQIFSAATNASVDRRGSLRWKEFSEIRVPLPSLEEQAAVASVLSSANADIRVLEKKLDYLKQEKKALMQQLLTGRVRVKV